MGLAITKGWVLVSTPTSYYLINTNYSESTWWELELIHFHILALFNGERKLEDVVHQVVNSYSTSSHKIKKITLELMHRYSLILEVTEEIRPTNSYIINKELNITSFQRSRNCAPMRLTWVITNECPMECIYCYMDASHPLKNKNYVVDTNKTHHLIQEAIGLGINEIIITGGEPFLIKNIYEVINMFLIHGIRVKTISKSLVDASKFVSQAQKNLKIEQSLDALDESITTLYTGKKHALTNAISSIDSYHTHKIPFSIKSVIGKNNLNAINELAKMAKEKGALSLQLVEYRPSLGRNVEDFSLNEEERIKIHQNVNSLRTQYNILIELDLNEKVNNTYTFTDTNINTNIGTFCGEGLKTLSFLSDGRVTRCPSAPKNEDITSENIFDEGIYKIWNHDKKYLQMVKPDEALYTNTACFSCDHFHTCNQTGRCVLVPLQNGKQMFDTDRTCQVM